MDAFRLLVRVELQDGRKSFWIILAVWLSVAALLGATELFFGSVAAAFVLQLGLLPLISFFRGVYRFRPEWVRGTIYQTLALPAPGRVLVLAKTAAHVVETAGWLSALGLLYLVLRTVGPEDPVTVHGRGVLAAVVLTFLTALYAHQVGMMTQMLVRRLPHGWEWLEFPTAVVVLVGLEAASYAARWPLHTGAEFVCRAASALCTVTEVAASVGGSLLVIGLLVWGACLYMNRVAEA